MSSLDIGSNISVGIKPTVLVEVIEEHYKSSFMALDHIFWTPLIGILYPSPLPFLV